MCTMPIHQINAISEKYRRLDYCVDRIIRIQQLTKKNSSQRCNENRNVVLSVRKVSTDRQMAPRRSNTRYVCMEAETGFNIASITNIRAVNRITL